MLRNRWIVCRAAVLALAASAGPPLAIIAAPPGKDKAADPPAEGPAEENLADPSAWPALVTIRSGSGRCSGTMVGAHAILSAASCVELANATNGSITAHDTSGNTYTLECDVAPAF